MMKIFQKSTNKKRRTINKIVPTKSKRPPESARRIITECQEFL